MRYPISDLLKSLELATIVDPNIAFGLSTVASDALEDVKDLHAVLTDALSENDVSSIKMRSIHEAEEELAAVGVLASVGHGEDTTSLMLVDEVLIFELGTVDALATGSVASSEISTLSHELSNNSVE